LLLRDVCLIVFTQYSSVSFFKSHSVSENVFTVYSSKSKLISDQSFTTNTGKFLNKIDMGDSFTIGMHPRNNDSQVR
jgi:hypothetical protein